MRMEQLAQFVSKSFDNTAVAAASVENAGCRASGRITLSVAHLIGDAVDDGDRRTCVIFPD